MESTRGKAGEGSRRRGLCLFIFLNMHVLTVFFELLVVKIELVMLVTLW
jgi:hypothetical protein